MGNYDKLLFQLLRGLSDSNIGFEELCGLLCHLGFEKRVRGSHHIFRKAGVPVLINLQKDGAKAKPYQVKQVRNIILQNRLGGSI
jgi:predicted RNA binding protein YcfA (HicA-like mRNA interferase family)